MIHQLIYLILNYIKKPNSFSNAYIAYRIMLPIHKIILLSVENKIQN